MIAKHCRETREYRRVANNPDRGWSGFYTAADFFELVWLILLDGFNLLHDEEAQWAREALAYEWRDGAWVKRR